MSNKGRLGFQIFLIWNAVRFSTVGVLVRQANLLNHTELNKITSDCCDCYFVSKDSRSYGIGQDKRFDLSYCMPDCVDCNWCDNHPLIDGTIEDTECAKEGYSQPHSWWELGVYISPSLAQKTGCTADNISITSMHIFEKKYVTYGHWALGVGITYALAMLVLACFWSNTFQYIALIVFIYNYIIAELQLYWIFKPYQYYRAEIGYEGVSIQCEIDSINKTAEDVLTVLLLITFSLLALQIIYVLLICCCCFRNCCRHRQSTDTHYRSMSVAADHRRCVCGWNSCFCDWDFIVFYGHVFVGAVVFLLMVFFAGLLIWAVTVMIRAGAKEDGYDTEKLIYIWGVNVLLFLSLWDILLFPFCWKGAKFICQLVVEGFGAISTSRSDSDGYVNGF